MPWKDPEKRREYERRRAQDPKRKEYHKELCEKNKVKIARQRSRRERIKRSNKTFVAIDAEGANTGETHELVKSDGSTCKIIRHKTFLWGASDAEGNANWLTAQPAIFGKVSPWLSTDEILSWLISLASKYTNAIFIGFAFSYDATQIFADLPYEKAWELQNGKAFEDRDDGKRGNPMGRVVLYKRWALSYLKAKHLTIYELRDTNTPFKIGKDGGQKVNYKRQVVIYDTFGFFQESFVKAAKGFPNAYSLQEMAIIEAGKKDRRDFDPANLAQIRTYQLAELQVLCRMLGQMRAKIEDRGWQLKRWQGAGSIAQAVLTDECVKPSLGECATQEPLPLEQEYAHRAYSGGRIEMLQQGYISSRLYTYDIRSAYPSIMRDLPSMEQCLWLHNRYEGKQQPKLDYLRSLSKLSMCKLRTKAPQISDHPGNLLNGADRGPPFYPFFYRETSGRIMYPPEVYGVYMIDEVLAAFDWREAMQREIPHFIFEIEITDVMECSIEGRAKPFDFINDIYQERKRIKAEIKAGAPYDVMEKVLKLGINSLYGKTAQAVGSGRAGKAPKFASPWHAAAVTAGTRAALLRAALQKPWDIVSFMTDGIVSRKPLDLDCRDELGLWEPEEKKGGGIFIQSGVYAMEKKIKSRGIRPDAVAGGDLGRWLIDTTRDLWRRKIDNLEFPYFYYLTLGAAIATEDKWQYAGSWISDKRTVNIAGAGSKRYPGGYGNLRYKQLNPTTPLRAYPFKRDAYGGELPLSEPSKPEWLNEEDRAEQELSDENVAIEMGRYDIGE